MVKLYSLTQDNNLDLTSLAADFLDDLDRRGYSQQTVRAYKSAINRLSATLGEAPIASITSRDLSAALANPDWSKETVAARQAAIKSFFSWLHDQGYTNVNPAEALGNIRLDQKLPRPIPRGDKEMIMSAANRLPLIQRTIFRLLDDLGCRVGEALGMDVSDVMWDKGQESIIIRHGKGGKQRVVPLLPDMPCYGLLRRLCRQQGSGAMFTSVQGARGDYDWAYYWWDKITTAAVLTEKQYTIHQLRHSRITAWVRDGMELLAVRRAAGHRDIRTTERYAQLDDQDVRNEMKKCGR